MAELGEEQQPLLSHGWGLSSGSAVKSRADNAQVMLIITQQSQPVTQVLIAFKELFLSPGRCWVWIFLGELSGPGCPRPPQALGTCSCLELEQNLPELLNFLQNFQLCWPWFVQAVIQFFVRVAWGASGPSTFWPRSFHQGQQSYSKYIENHLTFSLLCFS